LVSAEPLDLYLQELPLVHNTGKPAFQTAASPEPSTPNSPYPHHTSYMGTHIEPSNYLQLELDNQASTFFEQWSAECLKKMSAGLCFSETYAGFQHIFAGY